MYKPFYKFHLKAVCNRLNFARSAITFPQGPGYWLSSINHLIFKNKNLNNPNETNKVFGIFGFV